MKNMPIAHCPGLPIDQNFLQSAIFGLFDILSSRVKALNLV